MPALDEIRHFCCQEIIFKFSFCTLKSTFPEYMSGYRQLFYTFNEIMQQIWTKLNAEQRYSPVSKYKEFKIF